MPFNTTVTFLKTPNSLEEQHTSNRLLNLPEDVQRLIWKFVYQQAMSQLLCNHARAQLELEIKRYMIYKDYINGLSENNPYYWNNYYFKEADNNIYYNYGVNNYINNYINNSINNYRDNYYEYCYELIL